MQYLGNKAKIAAEMLRIITKDRNGMPYVEPFLGGGNTMCRVWHEYGRKIGGDSHPHLIEMWRALQQGWQPPEHVSREEYLDMQHNERNTPPHLYGYVGFCCSKFGKWWGGYSGVRKARPEYRIAEKSYQISARENLLAQVALMSTVELHHVDYRELPVPNEPCIIYCDPPYQDTTTYKSTQIDYAEFWQWCRVMHQQGNRVFVSGYSAPSDFTLLWEGRTVSMEATGATEKLYTIP